MVDVDVGIDIRNVRKFMYYCTESTRIIIDIAQALISAFAVSARLATDIAADVAADVVLPTAVAMGQRVDSGHRRLG